LRNFIADRPAGLGVRARRTVDAALAGDSLPLTIDLSYCDSVIHCDYLVMARTSLPVTVTLGDLKERVDARVRSGSYASASEVLRAAVRALDREDAAVRTALRDEIERSLNDPRPNIPAEKVFAKLRQRHARAQRRKS
jgi:antitoxin ParD1/3/4